MAKIVLKVVEKFRVGGSGQAGKDYRPVIYYDTIERTMNFLNFWGGNTDFNSFDWSLIYAYNPSLNNYWPTVGSNLSTNYNVQDADTGGGLSIHSYCVIPDEKEITTTNTLNTTGEDPSAFIGQTFLDTLTSEGTNAGVCAVTLNDLEIENVYVTYAGSVATVTITASGTNTAFTYCLGSSDSDTCQASNVFNVTISEETPIDIVVKDSQGFERSTTVVLTPQAQYGDRWIIQFYNRSGELCQGKIQQKGYVGVVTYPDSLGNPISINYREGSSSDAKYDVIKGSECNVTLVSSTSFEFLDLFEGEEDEFRLQYEKAGSLIWQGFSKNEGYSEAYQTAPYEIQLTFIDGLGTLKDKDYLDSNGEIFKGIKSEIDIISYCLLSTLHQLPIWVSIDIFERSFTQADTTTPLAQSYLNVDLFNEDDNIDSCYDVIEKILFSYGAQLFQEGGTWHIRCIDDIQTAYTQTKYSAYGEYTTNTTYNPAVTTTDSSTDPLIRFGQATLNIIPAYSKIIIEQIVNQRTNIVPNGDFNLIEKDGFYSNWNDSENVAERSAINNGDNTDNAIFLRGDASQDSGGDLTTFVSSDPKIITLSSEGTSLDVFIQFRVRSQDATPTNGRVKFYLQVGAYILKKDGSWTNDAGLGVSEYLDYNMNTEGFTFNNTHNININTNQLPEGGALQFRIFRPLGTGAPFTGIDVTKIRINTTQNQVKLPNKFNLKIENPDGVYTFTPDPMKLHISDWPQFDSPEGMLKNVRFKDAQGTRPTSQWNRLSVTAERTEIQNILLERFISNYATPTQEIQGEIHCINTNLLFSNTIADPNNPGKIFMISQMKTDEKEQIYSLTLLEILSEDLSTIYRVLEDGSLRRLEHSIFSFKRNVRIIE